jgi:hypothetical protein
MKIRFVDNTMRCDYAFSSLIIELIKANETVLPDELADIFQLKIIEQDDLRIGILDWA